MVSIEDLVVPLRTVDPEGDDCDLAVLRDVVGDARVVCLGESVHYGSELTRLRDRVLRFLVRELGFSVFALESGLPEGLAVDRWVHGADDDLEHVARTGITYAHGRCIEMHAQLRWMRAHDGPLAFWGIDVPGHCSNPAPGIATALARLGPRPGDAELLADADLGDRPPDPHATAAGAPLPPGLGDRIAALLARAEAAGDEVAARCVSGALAVVECHAHGLYRGPGRNLRNEVMADNLRWLLARHAPRSRRTRPAPARPATRRSRHARRGHRDPGRLRDRRVDRPARGLRRRRPRPRRDTRPRRLTGMITPWGAPWGSPSRSRRSCRRR